MFKQKTRVKIDLSTDPPRIHGRDVDPENFWTFLTCELEDLLPQLEKGSDLSWEVYREIEIRRSQLF